ncbi:MAG: putative cytochrome c class I [Rhodospirillaceae bacterium]|jgi:mono/diheme cytochrome c family protein|nr:MAG: putative cytochrome c class I [Rhodospirillaceae bacterium]TAN57120.1 MAG: cytochrome c [Magnetospirillum sp.]TNC97907.1 MAG: putative cytochrome c, class I precursor [Stygiobacter sp.]
MKGLLAHLPKLLVIGIVFGGVGLLLSNMVAPSKEQEGGPPQLRVPELSRVAAAGKRAFDTNCAECHGPSGSGTDKGPPLIHRIYNPGHHADEAFYRAVRDGVRRHHWNFGDMPPQPQITKRQIDDIIAYVREIQMANGIRWEEHRM